MANNNADVMEVTDWLLDFILKDYYKPLTNSLEKNRDYISFITDRNFSTRGGRYDLDCKNKDKVIKEQHKLFASFFEGINKLQNKALSEDSQQRIFFAAMLLKTPALKLGYCDEAEELLKIVTNPHLVGGFVLTDVKEDVLQILDNYGKRSILEEGKPYDTEVEHVIKEVCNGCMGRDTNNALSVEQMRETYNQATVVRGNTTYKMDGSVEVKPKSKA